MARSRHSSVLYIGVGSHVVAIRQSSGEELWRTKVKRSSFVTIHQDGDRIFAGSAGELFCLDARSGEVLWHNSLKGLGMGLVSFGGSPDSASSASAAAAAAAAATAAAVAAAT